MSAGDLSDEELRALLQLRCLPRLGDRRLARLLGEHGSAEALLGLPIERLSPGWDESRRAAVEVRAERALRLIERQGLQLWALHRGDYPAELRELPDAPVLLFGRGDAELLGRTAVAVVGTRRPTEYGVSVTEQLAAGIARAGVVVWSGLARGIDSVAHRSALAVGGATVAVLGSGIDVPYPREHGPLLEEIARSGLVLSEFMPGEPPLAHHFPQRNRILARLTHGVLVIEARPDGGALITAEAASASRTIMAVPGPIGRLTSLGPNRLIQDGAKLVMEVADVLEEFEGPLNAAAARGRPSARRHWKRVDPRARGDRAQLALGSQRLESAAVAAPSGAPPCQRAPRLPRDPVRAALAGGAAVHVDEIGVRSGLGTAAALVRLLELELEGYVEQLGGKRFRLSKRPDPERHRLAPEDAGPGEPAAGSDPPPE